MPGFWRVKTDKGSQLQADPAEADGSKGRIGPGSIQNHFERMGFSGGKILLKSLMKSLMKRRMKKQKKLGDGT